MSLVIRKLDETMIDDYIHFFDHNAFNDHSEYEGCYCAFYHFGKEVEEAFQHIEDWTAETKRRAIEMIKDKTLQGYLAYDGNDIVGWVSTNRKEKYLRIMENPIYHTENDQHIQSITCFIVDPKRRKEGIATKLLEHVIKSSKDEDIKYLEAYPRINTYSCLFNFHGYLSTFEKLGFKIYKTLEEDAIVRLSI